MKKGHQVKCGKRQSYERSSTAEMNKKLSEALKRLGEPQLNFRSARDRMIKKAQKEKDEQAAEPNPAPRAD